MRGGDVGVMLAGASEADCADARIGKVEVFAQGIDDLHTDIAMPAQKVEKLVASNFGDLHGVHHFCGDFVTSTGERGTQTQHLTGWNDTDSQAAPIVRADGKASASIAKHEDSTGGLAFAKEHTPSRKGLERSDFLELLERIIRKIAEHPIRASCAIQTGLRHIYLP